MGLLRDGVERRYRFLNVYIPLKRIVPLFLDGKVVLDSPRDGYSSDGGIEGVTARFVDQSLGQRVVHRHAPLAQAGDDFLATGALAVVAFAVGAGGIAALIAANGAWEATLMRARCGRTDGEGDMSVVGQRAAEEDRGRVGLRLRSLSPAERLTAREVVEY